MSGRLLAKRTAIAAALALVCGFGSVPAQAEGPFGPLAGSWSGTGRISLSSGARERIRCRAHYAPSNAGAALRLDLRCASDSFKFELRSNLSAFGSSVSGVWSEITRDVSGTISGTANETVVNVTARSPQFSAFLNVTTNGNRQDISIQSPGSEMSEVTISLARGSRR